MRDMYGKVMLFAVGSYEYGSSNQYISCDNFFTQRQSKMSKLTWPALFQTAKKTKNQTWPRDNILLVAGW